MDIKMLKNDLLTSQKNGTENAEVLNRMYLWFEEKGFLNKLRAHIRKQMMSALKDNSTLSTDKKNIASPKIQAINLLVADFLINQDNLFTLSVFITEVPLLGNLHEISTYVNHLDNNTQNIPVTKPSFQLNDVQDILEAIGILPNSDIMELTCQYYFNNSKHNNIQSLLTCIFKAITTLRNDHSKDDKIQDSEKYFKKSIKIENEHRLNNWLVSIEDILSSFNLNEEQISTLKKLLKRYHQNNHVQDTAMYREQLKKLEKLNKEVTEKVSDVEEMLASHFRLRENNLLNQKEQIEFVTQQLCLEQQQLQQLINIFEEKEKSMQEKLHQSEDEYNKKLQDIENQKHKLHLKEMEILKREKVLKEESMKRITETKIVESNKVKLLQEQSTYLEKQLLEIKSKLDNNPQRIEYSLGRESVRKLQRENDELRDFTKVQQQKIEELSNRVSSLAKNIEKTHQIPSPTIDYQTKNVKKKLKFVDDCSKKKCVNQNISSTTTDYSTTLLESDNLTEDDIIKEAHSKLKILEKNTAKVEQNLKNFKTNYMQHNTDSKINKINRRPYVNIRSNFSDDSDFGALKSNSNKINLKELANKIGYHRSIRKSLSQSLSENDTSPESMRNTRFQNNTNVTNISSIKVHSSNGNNTSTNLLISRPSLKMESPINKTNYDTHALRQSESLTESNTMKKLFPDNNFSELNNIEIQNLPGSNYDVKIENHKTSPLELDSYKEKSKENNCNDVQKNDTDLYSLNLTKIADPPQKSTYTRQDKFHETNSSSASKKELESDQTLSFGSNKSDKSSDFWP